MEKSLTNFIKKTALFLVLFLVPVIAVEVMLRQPLKDSYALKKYLIESTLSTNETLILGNSLAWSGINPNVIGSHCINVANYNQAFYSDFKILSKYVPDAEKLSTVILPLSAESFFTLPDERSDQMYAAYWGIEPYDKKWQLEHYSVVIINGLYNGIKKLFEPKEIAANKGWGEVDEVYNEDLAPAKSKLAYYRSQMKTENFDTCKVYLKDIINLCKDHNLRLILYFQPYSPVYNKLLEGDVYHEQMLNYMAELTRKESLECYNLNDNTLFPNACFRDFNHMNSTGASKLSGIIKDLMTTPRTDSGVNKYPLSTR